MRYRIKQDGDKFYPQHRWFIFWFNYYNNYFWDIIDVYKTSLEEAEDCLRKAIDREENHKNRARKIYPFNEPLKK